MSINFDNVFPFNQIETVTRDGQEMVKYPKTYIRCFTAPDGSKYAGKRCWMLSEFAQPGFHVHPAFMNEGQELDCFLSGAFEASNNGGKPESKSGKTPWVNISYTDAVAKCLLRNTGAPGSEQYGWHIETVYEYHFLSLLMLIEKGTPDMQTAIGSGNINGSGCVATGSTNATWRGRHECWANAWEIVDGLKTGSSGQALIWDKNGNHVYHDTGKIIADKGFAKGSTDNYDLGDLFIPADDGEGGTYSGSTADGVWTAANCVLYLGGSWYDGARDGAFAFYSYCGASYSDSSIGFRLGKYDI